MRTCHTRTTQFRHLRLPRQRLDLILQQSHRGRASVQEHQDLQAGQAGLGWLFDHMNVSVSESNAYVVLLKTGPPTRLFEQAKLHGRHLMLPSACHPRDARSVHGEDQGKG